MKAVILNITPQEGMNILNGKQLALLRKRVPEGFKGWVYLYCSKKMPSLYFSEYELKFFTINEKCDGSWGSSLNGKVVARFWFDEYKYFDSNYEDFIYNVGKPQDCTISYDKNWLSIERFEKLAIKESCLNVDELWDYFPQGVNDVGFALHIKNLEIFDKPKELGEFKVVNKELASFGAFGWVLNNKSINVPLTKAPQSYMFVEVEE